MSSITHEQAAGAAPHSDEHAHSDRQYWIVGGVLAALTAVEVSTYWWPHSLYRITAVALIVMMVVKFSMVALYFMHLKHDSKLLRRMFVAGIALALALFIATLSAMVFWEDSGTNEVDDTPRHRPMPPKPTDPPVPIKIIEHHG